MDLMQAVRTDTPLANFTRMMLVRTNLVRNVMFSWQHLDGDLAGLCKSRDYSLQHHHTPEAGILNCSFLIKSLHSDINGNNRQKCFSVLQSALDGDETAQRCYEFNRLLHFSTAPEWIKAAVRTAAKPFYNQVLRDSTFTITVDGNKHRFEMHFDKFPFNDKLLSDLFSLDCILTYDGAQRFMRHFKTHSEQRTNSICELIRRDPDNYPREPFSPMAGPPAGDIARELFKRVSVVLLNAQAIDDWFAFHHIPASDMTKRAHLGISLNPWQVAVSKEKLTRLLTWCDKIRSLPSLSAEEYEWLVDNIPNKSCSSSNFEQFVARMEASRKKASEPVQTITEQPTTAKPTSKPVVEVVDQRAVFFERFGKEILERDPRYNDVKGLTKKLYALHRKHAVDSDQLSAQIRNCSNLAGLPETIYREKLRRDNGAANGNSAFNFGIRPGQHYIIRNFETNGFQPFECWTAAIEDSQKALVTEQVKLIAEGNFSHIQGIRSPSKGLIVAELATASGICLYLTQPDDSHLELIFGGLKSAQNADIQRATQLLRLAR